MYLQPAVENLVLGHQTIKDLLMAAELPVPNTRVNDVISVYRCDTHISVNVEMLGDSI